MHEDTPNNAWDEPLPKYEVDFYGQYDQNYDSDRDLIKGIQNEDNFPIIIKTFSGYTEPNAFGSWAKYDEVVAEINDEDELYDFINSLPVNESCEKVKEGCDKELNEKKSKDPEKLAEEVDELKEIFEDFGPEKFYEMTFEEFENRFPVFSRDVIRDFLHSYVEITEDEMNDPEVINAWQEGTLIWPEDWKLLFVHADKQAAGKSPQWKDDVVVESLEEDLARVSDEDAEQLDNEIEDEMINLGTLSREAREAGANDIAAVADAAYDKFEDNTKQINEGNVDKLVKHYGPMFDKKEEELKEEKDYLVVPGDLDVLK